VDRRDGGSVGGPLVAACAGAKTDSKKNREKLAVLNTLAFIIFAPRSAQPNSALRSYSELGRCLGTHWAKLRYVYSETTGPANSAAKLLSKDDARRIAANIAKLPGAGALKRHCGHGQ
jgi:hypothetical protein